MIEEEIDQITRLIWQSLLSLDVERLEVPPPDRGPAVQGTVAISGAWTGVLVLRFASELARWATAIMLETDLASVSEEEMHDAIAELTNMIGGNLKSHLPQPSTMSIPEVETARGRSRAHDVLGQVNFACADHTLTVSLGGRSVPVITPVAAPAVSVP